MFSSGFRNPTGPNRVPSPIYDRKLLFSYAPDCQRVIDLFPLGYSPSHCRFANPEFITSAAFFLLDNVSGYKREFSVSDTSLRHTTPPLRHRIPSPVALAVAN
ncbi:hypothetical protein BJV77DRAFT_960138 [Russula vinacea]|nr:hypothetical protein BJV77DRAFT_960138 [Russula vinacea]